MDFGRYIPKSVHMSGDQITLLGVFGGGLDPNNRWLKLSRSIPWLAIEAQYDQQFDRTKGGPTPLPARVAFGSLIIQQRLSLTDDETVAMIQENPYLQAFLGFGVFSHDRPFDPSLMVHFRRRFGVDDLQHLNEMIVGAHRNNDGAGEDDEDADPPTSGASAADGDQVSSDDTPRGTLMMDATCAPADIAFPTDLNLLNHARELTEKMVDQFHAPYVGKHIKPRLYRRQARRDFLRLAKKKKMTRAKAQKGCRKQLRYLKRNLRAIDTRLLAGTWEFAALDATLQRKLATIRQLYVQQYALNHNNVRTVANRIISIDQPHVRPMVRGKARAAVEFGAKIAVAHDGGFAFLERVNWDAYHEAEDLRMHAETYRQRHGVYPERILGDKIYRTKANRAWCKARGIRLAGPGPGRPPADATLRRQREQACKRDEADRQPMEGIFGRAKRRFSLKQLMTRRPDTSATTIAMIFIVMNLERILCAFYQNTRVRCADLAATLGLLRALLRQLTNQRSQRFVLLRT